MRWDLRAPTGMVSRVENFKRLPSPEKMANPMKIPWLSWKILGTHEILENCVEMMNMSWKIPRKSENPLIFFEGHVKVTRNYMRKQLDEWSKLHVA